MNTRLLLPIACLLFCTLPSAASGKKGESGISFHLETEEGGNPKMVFSQLTNGEQRWFQQTPEVSTRDIVAFSPFPSDEEGTYGVVLQLDKRGANRLAAFTAANPQRWLVAIVNGRVVDAVIIDKQISDGILVIWKGVTLPEVKAFDKVKPRLGEDEKTWKKRLRDS